MSIARNRDPHDRHNTAQTFRLPPEQPLAAASLLEGVGSGDSVWADVANNAASLPDGRHLDVHSHAPPLLYHRAHGEHLTEAVIEPRTKLDEVDRRQGHAKPLRRIRCSVISGGVRPPVRTLERHHCRAEQDDKETTALLLRHQAVSPLPRGLGLGPPVVQLAAVGRAGRRPTPQATAQAGPVTAIGSSSSRSNSAAATSQDYDRSFLRAGRDNRHADHKCRLLPSSAGLSVAGAASRSAPVDAPALRACADLRDTLAQRSSEAIYAETACPSNAPFSVRTLRPGVQVPLPDKVRRRSAGSERGLEAMLAGMGASL